MQHFYIINKNSNLFQKMFTSEENLFLEAIAKMFSNSNEERKTSENNIQTWINQTYVQVLMSCNKFIICEELPSNIREYSCYLIKLCTGKNHYQDWQKISLDLKTSVQSNALGLLGNKIPSLRQQACIMVTSIFEVSIRDQGWPDLITILCNACNNDNIEFKISAINTLGMIWEKLPKEPFSLDELALMENTIINLLRNPQNEILALKCLKAYEFFIPYIKEKFSDVKYLEESLKMIITYCNSINNINTPEVVKFAIHRITQIILTAYDHVQTHFRHISEFFIELIKGNNEDLAVQAFIFFIEISYDEIDRKQNGFSYRKYIASIWDILWPCVQFVLNIGQNDDSDEFNRYKALNYLLVNLSILCDESIIEDIFKYMGEQFAQNDPSKISSAIYAFGSLVETVHVEKIESVIPSSLELMSKLFEKKDERLNFTLTWCFNKLSKHHGSLFVENGKIFSFFINIILNLLKDPTLENKIKMHLCASIFNLASYIYNNNLQNWNLFSPFLQYLLINLEEIAYNPISYNPDYNLSEKCFFALSALIECSHEKDSVLIAFFMEKIFIRLNEAQDIKNFGGNKETMYFYQKMLCLVVQGLSKNSVDNLIKLDNQKIENYFNLIEGYFKMRSGVFEEGLMALSGLIKLISNKEFGTLVKRLMEYIKFALNNYTDYQNCSSACLSLTDIISSCQEQFYIYIKDIYPLFTNIIKAENVNKNIFELIIVVYSDLFNYVGQPMWNYYQDPFDFMNQIMEFSKSNIDNYLNNKIDQDELNYFIKLNEGVVDFIDNVSGILKDSEEDKKELFMSFIPDIIEYLSIMFKNQRFNPSNDYLQSCLTFLINSAEIYQKYLFQKISDYTLQRVFQLANNSQDDTIIHLKDYFQNLIFAIKMKS